MCAAFRAMTLFLEQWGVVGPRVPHLFSLRILPFTTSLALLEGLLLWYWVELRLGQILLYGAGASVLTALTGNKLSRRLAIAASVANREKKMKCYYALILRCTDHTSCPHRLDSEMVDISVGPSS